jgi:hypothetical protein
MKKNELSPEDFSALANAVAELPFVTPKRQKTDYILDICETVINFHIRVEVVVSSLSYFLDHVQQQQQIYTHHDLKAVLARFPDDEEGNKAASQFLWGTFLWTRIALLRQLIVFFESVGVTDQASLHAWAARSTFERDFAGKVKGLGIAVFHWLQIRCHVDSVKPDVHVLNFGKRVIGRRVSEKVLVDAISQIAPLVGQSMATVDVTVWFWGRLGMANDKPGMRLIAWNMLKAGLEEKLREEVLQDFNWQLILDPPEKLRFSEAGLTIQPDRSLFGETVPGTTSATIQQSCWTEGLALAVMIRHDTSLPLPLFEKLQENLVEEYGWEAANEPNFTASLDMEDSLLMTAPMSYQELAEWVADQIEKALPGLTTIRG